MTAPCKGCEKRHEACHDTCPAFIEWKAWKEVVNAKRRADADIQGAKSRSKRLTMARHWKK